MGTISPVHHVHDVFSSSIKDIKEPKKQKTNMVVVWDGIIYFCTTSIIEGQTNTISKTHGQKPNPIALPSKNIGHE